MARHFERRKPGNAVVERNLVFGIPEWLFAVFMLLAYFLLLS